ncbi:MAG: hypothetical protein CVU14_11210 [Bacteroidetes bacterium HGW-Bacteroidetes-9]|nr:MAG: hypothetical protein CVU14_11210 [Bacteroidetes bacterium HGW-Bacteroidetes-9]
MKYFFIILLLTSAITASAQVDHVNDIRSFTPSVLLNKKHWEYKMFNNLYSQTSNFNLEGRRINNNERSSYFTSINQFLYGISDKINIGADIWIKSVRLDDVSSSPFEIFRFENDSNNRTALTGIGPKVKFSPLKKLPGLSVQSTFLFPIAKDEEGKTNGKPYLSEDSFIWITQIFYDQPIGNKFQLFFQIAPWVYVKKTKPEHSVSRLSYSNPVSIFLSYYATPRLTFYLQNEWWPSFGSGGISSWFWQEGIGMKIQLIKGLMEAEASYTRFIMGKNSGAGETYNLGLRLIH